MKKFGVFFLVLICLFVFLFPNISIEEDPQVGRVLKPMVYVNDNLYGENGCFVYELPEDSTYFGAIKEVVSSTEPMVRENFYSNTFPKGSKIYGSKTDLSTIYIEYSASGQTRYSIYENISNK